MQQRKLGSELEVSAIGLGCMSMSGAYGTAEERDETESIAAIHRAIELGVTSSTPLKSMGRTRTKNCWAARCVAAATMF
jgi:hypothetical protein